MRFLTKFIYDDIMKNVKVSIIIPVYNTEKYLEKCLDSVVNQTLKDIEVICINDGSTDSSLEILEKFANKDNRIKIFNTNNNGAGAARNIGLQNFNGEYVIFMDSDDWIRENTHEILYNFAKSNDSDMVMFKMINYDESKNNFYKDYVYELEPLENFHNGEIFHHEDIDPSQLFSIATGTVNKFYKSSFLQKINAQFPEGYIFEDNPFFFNNLFNAKKISILNKCLYFRRRRENSVMGSRDERYLDIFPITNILFDIFRLNGQFDKYKEILYNQKIETFKRCYEDISIDFKAKMYDNIKNDFLSYKNTSKGIEFENSLNNSNFSFYKRIFDSERFQEFDTLTEIEKFKKINKKNKKKIKEQKKQIKKFKNSFSWKITKPMRKFSNFFKKFINHSVFLSILMIRKDFKKSVIDYKGYNKIKKLHLFDEDFYKNEFNKEIPINPLIHYMYYGYKKGKNPNADFTSKFYLKNYSNVKKANLNPLVHYVLYGKEEGKLKNIYEKIDEDIKKDKTENKKRILYILHAFGGGTSQTNEDLMQHVEKEYECYLLYQKNNKMSLLKYKNKKYINIGIWNINSNWSIDKLYDEKFEKMYYQILKNLNVDLIHIRHLINHTFDLPNVAHKMNIPIILSFHDFYFICPSYCLLDGDFNYCGAICNENSIRCVSFLNMGEIKDLRSYVDVWRYNIFKLFSKINSFVTTSKIVKDLFLSVFPEMQDENFHIIEHGRDFLEEYSNTHSIPSEGDPIKILFPGILKEHKGSEVIREIKELDKESKLEFHFLGKIPDSLSNVGIYHGEYDRGNFSKKVSEIKPSFIGIFSIWPETYCHTLTESWSCNVPVISSKIGVIEDRMLKNDGGWFIDIRNPHSAYNDILKISNDTEGYIKIQKNLKNINFKNSEKMAEDYLKIYKNLIG